ncbi:MAG: CHASE2 domain-containing protein, partial [Pseudomonadota bacterium]
DGVIRRYPVYHELDGWRLASLPARVARDLGYAVPEEKEQVLVWHGPARGYKTISLHEVLPDFERSIPQRRMDEFRDKIVVIGTTAPGLHDIKLTPMQSDFPGPEVLATALDNLKNGDRLYVTPTWTLFAAVTLALALLATAFARNISPARVGAWLLSATALLAAGGWAGVVYTHTSLPVTGVVAFSWLYFLPAAVRAFWLERQQRQRVTQLFSRFLDPRVVTGIFRELPHRLGVALGRGQHVRGRARGADLGAGQRRCEQRKPRRHGQRDATSSMDSRAVHRDEPLPLCL